MHAYTLNCMYQFHTQLLLGLFFVSQALLFHNNPTTIIQLNAFAHLPSWHTLLLQQRALCMGSGVMYIDHSYGV